MLLKLSLRFSSSCCVSCCCFSCTRNSLAVGEPSLQSLWQSEATCSFRSHSHWAGSEPRWRSCCEEVTVCCQILHVQNWTLVSCKSAVVYLPDLKIFHFLVVVAISCRIAMLIFHEKSSTVWLNVFYCWIDEGDWTGFYVLGLMGL